MKVIYYFSALLRRMLSSAGRASPLQGGGRRFEPVSIHHLIAQTTHQQDGRVAKRLNAADCKSATYWFRQFESAPSHHYGLLGCSQAVRQQTLTLSSHWFDPSHPSHKLHSLAQPVEHLTFNQGVWSSILQRVTILMPRWRNR